MPSETKLREQSEEAKAAATALEVKLEQQQAKMEAQTEKQQQQETERLREQAAEGRVREALTTPLLTTALLSRLEALHTAKLLTDAELDALEDVIADSCEAATADGSGQGAGGPEVARMAGLSDSMASDRAFARQLRRKFTQ